MFPLVHPRCTKRQVLEHHEAMGNGQRGIATPTSETDSSVPPEGKNRLAQGLGIRRARGGPKSTTASIHGGRGQQ